MSCNRPLTAFKTGLKTEKGKDDLLIIKGNADVISLTTASKLKKMSIRPNMDFMYQDGGEFWLYQKVMIPCGKCVGCLESRRRTWSDRMSMEMKYYDRDSCWFVTLTFDDEHLPADGCVSKRDLQLFFKRLRKRDVGEFKYIACGEYGRLTFRPHYHFCALGLRLSGKFIADKTFQSPELIASWPFGRVQCFPCNDATIGYVCGYVNKKLTTREAFLSPVFLFSKGLGKRYFYDHKDEILNFDSVYMNGRKRVPQYFDKLMEKEADFLELLKFEENKNFRKEKGERALVSSLALSGLSCLEELQDKNDKLAKSRIKARNVDL